MKPTKTHGVCSHCREPNPYTRTNCVRCEARLAWAFLVDGKDDKDFDNSLAKLFHRLAGSKKELTHYKVHCRFCRDDIDADEKVCTHCGKWLTVPEVSRMGWSVVDSDAPEIQNLLKRYRKDKILKATKIDNSQ